MAVMYLFIYLFWSHLGPFVKLYYFCRSTHNFSLMFYFQALNAIEHPSTPICAPSAWEWARNAASPGLGGQFPSCRWRQVNHWISRLGQKSQTFYDMMSSLIKGFLGAGRKEWEWVSVFLQMMGLGEVWWEVGRGYPLLACPCSCCWCWPA